MRFAASQSCALASDDVDLLFDKAAESWRMADALTRAGVKPGKTPPKTGWELLTDPHFVFTICSLAVSVTVFFYYLYKLLCDSDDLSKQFNEDLERRRKARAEMLKLSRSGSDSALKKLGGSTDGSAAAAKPAAPKGAGAAIGDAEAAARAKVRPADAKKDDDLVRRIAAADAAAKAAAGGGPTSPTRRVVRRVSADSDAAPSTVVAAPAASDEGMRKRK